MSDIFLRITSDDTGLPGLLTDKLGATGSVFVPYSRHNEPLDDKIEVIVGLNDATSFVSLYRILSGFLEAHENREVSICRGDQSLTIKGSVLPERRELETMLVPELKAL